MLFRLFERGVAIQGHEALFIVSIRRQFLMDFPRQGMRR
ncbi:hypothetical protein EV291_14420 [Rhizobium sp. BK068]|nr:hypothetical protein [Rhizobium sp. BK060]TCM65018.1 hypothetical protein EV291_14420 [Rhizobium sp. BK068]